MNYEDLITTISAIINNDDINKIGLTLTYELSEKNHRQMNQDFFYKENSANLTPIYSDIFEVEIEGILVKFVKKVEL